VTTGVTNAVAAVAFTIGGLLFALGAAVAQLGSGDASTAAAVYFCGGIFFTTGGYASLLVVINSPEADGGPTGKWRWWRYQPLRRDWLSAFVLFAGTLAFGISLIDAFIEGLSTQGVNRLIWAPEMFGCLLFLISGRIALLAFSRDLSRLRPRRELDWWIVFVNQVGSVLFFISAVADYTRPATGSVVNVDIANWGTLTGALCFAVGGAMQAFVRPTPRTAAAFNG
jgi:hypothetical protein